jgi:hypothetical protein
MLAWFMPTHKVKTGSIHHNELPHIKDADGPAQVRGRDSPEGEAKQ